MKISLEYKLIFDDKEILNKRIDCQNSGSQKEFLSLSIPDQNLIIDSIVRKIFHGALVSFKKALLGDNYNDKVWEKRRENKSERGSWTQSDKPEAFFKEFYPEDIL